METRIRCRGRKNKKYYKKKANVEEGKVIQNEGRRDEELDMEDG
jgi:hypothetical protein